jgi:Tol biopolymer transport system component
VKRSAIRLNAVDSWHVLRRHVAATKGFLLLTAGWTFSLTAPAAAQEIPGTDIWILPLAPLGASVAPSGIIRATDRPGYDNQPHFTPGDQSILYTSVDSAGQADIWIYDVASGTRRNVTSTTPESEYSATVMPSLARFSVIRVEADSTQRLWSFDSAGGRPELVLKEIQPIGYHTWIDEDRVAVFVLGTPATLQLVSVATGAGEVIAENIGRSIQTEPVTSNVTYVQWEASGEGWITLYDPETGDKRVLVPLLEGNEFFAWTPDGALIMGQGSKLFRFVEGLSTEWVEIADLQSAGIRGISRIAVSRSGDLIAVVAEGGQ